MKKTISILLTAIMMFSVMFSGPLLMDVKAADSGTTGKCTWSISGTVLTISGTGAMANYAASSTSIDGGAPWGTTITKVIIEKGVTSIGDNAFFRCSSLSSVQISNTVKSIGENAFWCCSRLEKITIPDSVSIIWDSAFALCNRLSNVIIQDSCDIKKQAFYDCSGLTSITFGGRISVYQDAFYGCDNLEKVYMNSVKNWCNSYFANASANPIYPSSANLYLNNKLVTNLVIPDDVERIQQYAFYYYKNLVSVTMGSGVTSIGDRAFMGCNPIDIYIKDVASWCNIEFDDQPLSCGGDLYLNNKLLTNLTIPSKVKKINDNAFYGCDHLQSVSISEGVEHIGASAFAWCSNMENIELPSSLTYLGDAAFLYCDNINKKTYNNGMYIGNNKNPFLVLVDTETTSFGTFELSSDTHFIHSSAFSSCNNFTELFLPSNILGIGNYAFWGCPLQDVWYCGSNEDREGIVISSSNSALNNAEWHYDTCVNEHNYVSECDSTCEKCEWEREIVINGDLKHHYLLNENLTCDVCGYSKQPKKPEIESKTGKEVVLKLYDFYEYSKDGSTWQDGNVFKELQCNTEYTFYQRVKATENSLVSAQSEGLTIFTDNHLYSLNTNSTCEYCGHSRKPAKPVVGNHFSGTVELVKVEGMEYSKDGIAWQSSNVFSELSGNTTYTFYQRVKATSTVQVSEASDGLTVYLKANKSKPSAPIISNYTDKTVTLIQLEGAEYSLDGAVWQTSNVFTNLLSGTKYTFYQRYAETDTHEASPNSTGTSVTTDKSKQTLVPNAPTIQSSTSSSITLVAIEGCEYSKNGTIWQSSNVFGGLSCGTEYTFYQRYKETSSTYAGKSSECGIGRTDKGTQSTPSRPSLSKKTHNSVTLTAYSGYEYSKDGINWQTSNVFTGLNPETNYLFYQRKAESEQYYASGSSISLTVKTDEAPQYITGDFNNDESVTDADALYLLYHTIFGDSYPIEQECDYNNDGSVTDADALYLLYHTIFGDDYPLN